MSRMLPMPAVPEYDRVASALPSRFKWRQPAGLCGQVARTVSGWASFFEIKTVARMCCPPCVIGKNQEAETKRINKELANIREKFGSSETGTVTTLQCIAAVFGRL